MIRLEGLQVAAGDFSLRIQELTVEEGEFLVFLGPTGSGKTVLLETLAGLRRPRKGRIWFGDRDVTEETPERRQVGFVYQDYALFPHLTVAKNIAFGLGLGGARDRSGRSRVDQDRVVAMASLLGIEQLLDRYPDTLSGGEQQRVALARALAIAPGVLLLDEPLSALDRRTRQELRVELKRLHQQLGTTVLHVTHDLDEAVALGDRIAVLIDGGLRQLGINQDILRRPADAAVARLIGMSNVFPISRFGGEDGGPTIRLRGGSADDTGADAGAVDIAVDARHGESSGLGSVAVIPAEEIVLRAAGDSSDASVAEGGAGRMNLLEGTVRDIQTRSIHASVEVDVPPSFMVHVLRPDVQRMGLAPGSRVRLWIPPEVVHVCPESLGSSQS